MIALSSFQPVTTIKYTPASVCISLVRIASWLPSKRGTGLAPSAKKTLQIELTPQMPTRPLPNICDANKNPLRVLDVVKRHVNLGTTQAPLRSIVCKILATEPIIKADFCDQYFKAVRLIQNLVELDRGHCIPIVRKSCVCLKSQPPLPDGLIYIKGNPGQSTLSYGYLFRQFALQQPRFSHTHRSLRRKCS